MYPSCADSSVFVSTNAAELVLKSKVTKLTKGVTFTAMCKSHFQNTITAKCRWQLHAQKTQINSCNTQIVSRQRHTRCKFEKHVNRLVKQNTKSAAIVRNNRSWHVLEVSQWRDVFAFPNSVSWRYLWRHFSVLQVLEVETSLGVVRVSVCLPVCLLQSALVVWICKCMLKICSTCHMLFVCCLFSVWLKANWYMCFLYLQVPSAFPTAVLIWKLDSLFRPP